MNSKLVFIIILFALFLSCGKTTRSDSTVKSESINESFTNIGTSLEKQNEPINIFENDIFEGIAQVPSYYKNDPRFIVSEDYPKDEMEKQYYDYRILVKNEAIQIEYWVFDSDCKLMLVTIIGNTDISKWGKYIGMSKENVLSLFGIPKTEADKELHYFREDGKYAVHFWFKDNCVNKIDLAGSL